MQQYFLHLCDQDTRISNKIKLLNIITMLLFEDVLLIVGRSLLKDP